MTVSDAKRRAALEDGKAKLKTFLAERLLGGETFDCHWPNDNG